MYTHAA
jgi:hypothetical protein